MVTNNESDLVRNRSWTGNNRLGMFRRSSLRRCRFLLSDRQELGQRISVCVTQIDPSLQDQITGRTPELSGVLPGR